MTAEDTTLASYPSLLVLRVNLRFDFLSPRRTAHLARNEMVLDALMGCLHLELVANDTGLGSLLMRMVAVALGAPTGRAKTRIELRHSVLNHLVAHVSRKVSFGRR